MFFVLCVFVCVCLYVCGGCGGWEGAGCLLVCLFCFCFVLLCLLLVISQCNTMQSGKENAPSLVACFFFFFTEMLRAYTTPMQEHIHVSHDEVGRVGRRKSNLKESAHLRGTSPPEGTSGSDSNDSYCACVG